MAAPWPHLGELAQAVIEKDDRTRIYFAREPHWVSYPRAREVLALFQELLERPRVPRSPCFLLLGATNNGKTALFQRFCDHHPFQDDGRGNGSLPVFYLSAPPIADEKRFYDAILEAMDVRRPGSTVAGAQANVIRVFRALGVQILFVDEIQHLVAAGAIRSRQMMSVLKYMSNDLQISIVGAGVQTAFHAIQSDDQMANRFKPVVLPRWELNEEFLKLLASFELLLPLRKPSHLTDKDLAVRLHGLVDGKIGELATLLADAAVEAIRTGQERITLNSIRQLGWVSPEARKHAAEGLG